MSFQIDIHFKFLSSCGSGKKKIELNTLVVYKEKVYLVDQIAKVNSDYFFGIRRVHNDGTISSLIETIPFESDELSKLNNIISACFPSD